jgi:phosphatidylglycerophosphate synthase
MELFVPKDSESILFKKVFAHSVFKQSLLYYQKVKKETSFTLYAPQLLKSKIKQTIEDDKDLAKLNINLHNDTGMPKTAKPINLVHDVYGASWEITSNTDLTQLRKELKTGILKNCQTPVARNINKRISIPISHVFANGGISPNSVTFFALLLSVAGALLLLSKDGFFFAFALFQLNSILDGTDGEIAKFNFAFSDFGKKFDVYGDYFTSFCIIVFTNIAFYIFYDSYWVHFISILSISLLVSIGLIWIAAILLKLTPDNFAEVESLCQQRLKSPKSMGDRINKVFLAICQRDFYIFFLFLFSLFKWGTAIHVFILLVCFAWLMLTIFTLRILIQLKKK